MNTLTLVILILLVIVVLTIRHFVLGGISSITRRICNNILKSKHEKQQKAENTSAENTSKDSGF